MESKFVGFRLNPVEDLLLKKYLRESGSVGNKSDLLRNLVSKFLVQQGLL